MAVRVILVSQVDLQHLFVGIQNLERSLDKSWPEKPPIIFAVEYKIRFYVTICNIYRGDVAYPSTSVKPGQ